MTLQSVIPRLKLSLLSVTILIPVLSTLGRSQDSKAHIDKIASYQEAIRRDSSDLNSYLGLGLMLLKTNPADSELKKVFFKALLLANTKKEKEAIGISDLGLGECALYGKSYPRAAAYFSEALEMLPDTSIYVNTTLISLGIAFQDTHNGDKAKELYQKVLLRDSSNAEAKKRLEQLARPQAKFISVDKEPKPLFPLDSLLHYPDSAVKARIEGSVRMRILVRGDGSVKKAQIEQSSGYSILDQAALDAALKEKFEPAIQEGKPVSVWFEAPIRFHLRDTTSKSQSP